MPHLQSGPYPESQNRGGEIMIEHLIALAGLIAVAVIMVGAWNTLKGN